MKVAERLPWVALTTVEGPTTEWREWSGGICLCSVCRYAKWSGGSCEDSIVDCLHPLLESEEVMREDASEGKGKDCWAFRPGKGWSIELAADVVGLYLQGLEPDWRRLP